jgi:hypothetical protein
MLSPGTMVSPCRLVEALQDPLGSNGSACFGSHGGSYLQAGWELRRPNSALRLKDDGKLSCG